MGRYVLKRLTSLVPILVGISILVFLILHLVPGNPVLVMLGTEANDENVAALTKELGLDRPLPAQYLDWIGGVLRGDLGESVRTRRAIGPELLGRFVVTFELSLLSLLMSWVIAIPVGILSASKPGGGFDLGARIAALLGISVPGFAVGTVLILGASLLLGWYPPLDFTHLWSNPALALQKLVLPAFTQAVALAGGLMRMTRSSLLDVLGRDFIRTAKAKGNPPARVLARHAFRNASIPVVTLVGMQFGYLLGGSVIVEQIFSVPGIGQFILDGIYHRDYPAVQGGVLFVAAVFVVVNLLVDLVYTAIDPRIKY